MREIYWQKDYFPVLSSIEYSSVASKVLLSAKESQIRAADDLIVSGLLNSLNFFTSRFGAGTLVPIPSRKSATRKRGRDFLYEITSQLAKKSDLTCLPMLTHIRKVRDQSQLNLPARSINIAGAFSISEDFLSPDLAGNIGPKIIVIDDLITSGATLGEAIRALRSAGFTVLGAVTSCTAQPLR